MKRGRRRRSPTSSPDIAKRPILGWWAKRLNLGRAHARGPLTKPLPLNGGAIRPPNPLGVGEAHIWDLRHSRLPLSSHLRLGGRPHLTSPKRGRGTYLGHPLAPPPNSESFW